MLTTATMKRRPTPPGEMLLEEYLKPARMTQVALAAKMGVPIQRVNGIISGRRAVTAETAILLSRALGTTPELWLNLQVAVDLWDARQRMPRDRARRVVARAHAPARSVRAKRHGSEDDWFDYRLENDPRFLTRVEKARASLRAGRGVRL
jgi:addiction module HigA family antidote